MGSEKTTTSWAPSFWGMVSEEAPSHLSGLAALAGSGQNAPSYTLPSLVPIGDPTPPSSLASGFLNALLDAPLRPLTAPLVLSSTPWEWFYVIRRFDRLIENMGVTKDWVDDGDKKQAGVRACLNRHYWGSPSETANSLLIGSWAKFTRVRPIGDIDIMFLLPKDVYWRFQERSGNKQSQLLQELRGVLSDAGRYRNTDISGDGQVIVVSFDSITVEVVPAFRCETGELIICDTKNDGRYKVADPAAELAALNASDARWNGNTRALVRMVKRWQQYRDAKGLKAFQIERLVIDFLALWPYSFHNRFWYDWMMRDFFQYLLGRPNGVIQMPGTGEHIGLGSEWLVEARFAYANAILACNHERANNEVLAGQSWQRIFGSVAPERVS